MSLSDNEDFESADEDIVDDNNWEKECHDIPSPTKFTNSTEATSDVKDTHTELEVLKKQNYARNNNYNAHNLKQQPHCEGVVDSMPVAPRQTDISKDVVDTHTLTTDSSSILLSTAIIKQPHNEVSPSPAKSSQGSTGWGSWSSWGASFMAAASSSVSTFTSHVEEGWNTVLDTVESSLGAPNPEDMAKHDNANTNQNAADIDDGKPVGNMKNVESKEASGESESEEKNITNDGFWSTLGIRELDEITSLVTDKGKKLVSGSLDVLETIGKKTYNVVTHHDPGLKKARNIISHRGNRPNLSALLKEAKQNAKERATMEEGYDETSRSTFSFIFDEFQGLAHLEALEMLSGESENRVQMLVSSSLVDAAAHDELIGQLDAVRAEFGCLSDDQIEDEEDEDKDHNFIQLVTDHLSCLQLATPNKLTPSHSRIRSWLDEFHLKEPYEPNHASQAKDTQMMAVRSLAELTAMSMEQFQKIAEQILLRKGDIQNVVQLANNLASLTRVLCTEVNILSIRFNKCLSLIAAESSDSDLIHPLMTMVYLEASNSSTYIHDAFQLLLPVIEQAAIDRQST